MQIKFDICLCTSTNNVYKLLHHTCQDSVNIHNKEDKICVTNKLAWIVFLKQRKSLQWYKIRRRRRRKNKMFVYSVNCERASVCVCVQIQT